VFCLCVRMDDVFHGEFGFVHFTLSNSVAQCEGFSRPKWITKSVTLTNDAMLDVTKEICHSVNVDLVVDSDGQSLGDECVAIQIVEALCEEDIPSDWMFSMRAWHITRVFLNGASLFDHEQRFIILHFGPIIDSLG
jgi:hypothetical protein